MADGAGAEDKKSAIRDMRARIERVGAKSYAAMVNSSHDQHSVASYFPFINLSSNVFPPQKEIRNCPLVRKVAEAHYWHVDPTQDELEHFQEGVMRYRFVSGDGPYEWHDFIQARNLCTTCSRMKQVPVWHSPAECTHAGVPPNLPPGYKTFVPDPNRRQGPQKRQEKPPKTNRINCPVKGCGSYVFSADRMNAHLRKVAHK